MGNVAQQLDLNTLSLEETHRLIRAMAVREVRYTALLRRATVIMESIAPFADQTKKQELVDTIKEIGAALDTAEQHRFSFVIETMQGTFLTKLAQDYPTLTPTELRLAVFLRLPMPSRDIARLFSCSVRSVEKHRERMRKKFGLTPKSNLSTFLASRD